FQSQKPATSSFVSANGPSITVRSSPSNLTRAPFELGCSPSPASITPALVSSSLYFPVAVRSSLLGRMPASEDLVALTMTMNRIVLSRCVGAAELFVHQLVACEALNLPTGNVDHERQTIWGIGQGAKPEVQALFRESK